MNAIHPTAAHNVQFLQFQAPTAPSQHSPLQPTSINSRRILRPRTEPRSYVESPEVLINGSLDGPRTNGNLSDYSSADSSDCEMPLMPIKELSPAELKQR